MECSLVYVGPNGTVESWKYNYVAVDEDILYTRYYCISSSIPERQNVILLNRMLVSLSLLLKEAMKTLQKMQANLKIPLCLISRILIATLVLYTAAFCCTVVAAKFDRSCRPRNNIESRCSRIHLRPTTPHPEFLIDHAGSATVQFTCTILRLARQRTSIVNVILKQIETLMPTQIYR